MKYEQSPYRGVNNKWITKQLFYELWYDLGADLRVVENPPFTLFADKEGKVNFGKAYVDLGDPSGYKITQELLFGQYGHWLALNKCLWFKDAKAVWDEELEAKLYSEGLDVLRTIAASDDKGALQAARVLVTKGYLDKKPVSKRGRPSQEELNGKLKQELEDHKDLQSDLERIRAVK